MKRTFCLLAVNLLVLGFAAVGATDYLDWEDDDPGDDAAIVSLYLSADKIIAHHARPRTRERIPENAPALDSFKPPVSPVAPSPAATGQDLLRLLSLQRK